MGKKTHSCPIALSVSHLGDHWTLVILRDILFLEKTRFKEFIASREGIASNILSNRLKTLLDKGFIELLNPLGTKKSRQYIATDSGIATLSIIIEMYLFSVHTMPLSLFTEEELEVKKELLESPSLFKEKTIKKYLIFKQELLKSIVLKQQSVT